MTTMSVGVMGTPKSPAPTMPAGSNPKLAPLAAPTSTGSRGPKPSIATSDRTSTSRSAAAMSPASTRGLLRETYDAQGKELLGGELGKLVRKEGQGPSGDVVADAAHDNAKVVYDFYREVLGRDSIDDKGMQITSVVHYGRNFQNAFWDGDKMTYGDGDGATFGPFSQSLDVVAHEMSHGVTERSANLRYRDQSGALNESWSDVFGELVEQWHERRDSWGTLEGAKQADWLIGEDIFTPATPGDALRSMKAPGTAHPSDPQPGHMRDYVHTTKDNGGVHYNSGIPNKAAYEAAIRLGGDKTAKIWYRALTEYLTPTAQFSDAANATLTAAKDLFDNGPEVQAVRDAWTAVGITPGTKPSRPVPRKPALSAPPSHAGDGGVVPPWLRAPVADALSGVGANRALR